VKPLYAIWDDRTGWHRGTGGSIDVRTSPCGLQAYLDFRAHGSKPYQRAEAEHGRVVRLTPACLVTYPDHS